MKLSDLLEIIQVYWDALKPIIAVSIALSGVATTGRLIKRLTSSPKPTPPHEPTPAELEAERVNRIFWARWHMQRRQKESARRFHDTSRKARQGRVK